MAYLVANFAQDFSNKQDFSTGETHNFVVPDNVTVLRCKLWGPSGAAGAAGIEAPTKGGNGGPGGFIQCDLPVTPGETLVCIIGIGGDANGGRAGFSRILRGSMILACAAGGGSGGNAWSGGNGLAGDGGFGGGLSGTPGTSGSGGTYRSQPGGGGTQTAGGIAGASGNPGPDGTAGTQNAGGVGGGNNTANGRGGYGGYGWWGGGGGEGGSANSSNRSGGGGGGGSSHAIPQATNVTTSTGSWPWPAFINDPDYNGSAGKAPPGATSGNGAAGSNGQIVLRW